MHPIGELSHAECERLLRAGVFGRMVFPGDGRIEVLPVNYTTVDDELTERERAAAGHPRWVQRNGTAWLRLRWDEMSGRRGGLAWEDLSELPVRRIGA